MEELGREIILTKDGSHTIQLPGLGITYHSIHGALQESMHVFIAAGLQQRTQENQLSILEMGFGTGLNALLTAMHRPAHQSLFYHSVERYPLAVEEWQKLNYGEIIEASNRWQQLHHAAWGIITEPEPQFQLLKTKADVLTMELEHKFDICYYDAFAPSAQPELWSIELFRKLRMAANENALLVTYCSKGDVRRALLAAGWQVEKLQGPPGKREMLRAINTNAVQ